MAEAAPAAATGPVVLIARVGRKMLAPTAPAPAMLTLLLLPTAWWPASGPLLAGPGPRPGGCWTGAGGGRGAAGRRQQPVRCSGRFAWVPEGWARAPAVGCHSPSQPGVSPPGVRCRQAAACQVRALQGTACPAAPHRTTHHATRMLRTASGQLGVANRVVRRVGRPTCMVPLASGGRLRSNEGALMSRRAGRLRAAGSRAILRGCV